MNTAPVRVVIAAGGLGSRVAGWAQLLPKEFQPVDGRPALLHLLDEIAVAGGRDAVFVYHRYYEPFIAWTRSALRPGATTAYRIQAGLPPSTAPEHEALRLLFVRQTGPYADITSVLNGADHLPTGTFYVAFADNLYLGDNALALLQSAPGTDAAVLARPFDPELAPHRGVIVTTGSGQRELLVAMVEKPDSAQLEDLICRHSTDHLRLLEGRFRISADFLATLRAGQRRAALREPHLSERLAAHGRLRPVHVVTTDARVIDLGRQAEIGLERAQAIRM